MFNWQPLLGVVLLLFAVYTVIRGRIRTGDDYGNSTVIDRQKNPVYFWLVVAGQIFLAFLLFFHVFPG
jgi:hypothetical protein